MVLQPQASSCKSRRQSPHTMVFHHPWAAAWHAKVYPTQKRGRLARPLRARRDTRFSGARLAGPQPCVRLRPSLASSRRIRRWSMRRDALGSSGQTCTGAEAPAPNWQGRDAEGIDSGQSYELDVVLDGVVRSAYNRSRQRWHLPWGQPVLSRSSRSWSPLFGEGLLWGRT